MKISKSLLKTIAVAVVVTTSLNACVKDDIKTFDENNQPVKRPVNQPLFGDGCPGCGMG